MKVRRTVSQNLKSIADKRFLLLRSRLPFLGLSDTFVHCAQKAEDIDTISVAHDNL